MEILFVVGGSYKAFYLNHLKKYKNIDLIVFQEKILYNYDYYSEMLEEGTVTYEILSLSKKLNCIIVAKISTTFLDKEEEAVLFCDKKKVYIFDINRYIKYYYKGKVIKISIKELFMGKADIFIKISKKRVESKNLSKICANYCFLCDKTGVERLKKGKSLRKFRKICYFSLKF